MTQHNTLNIKFSSSKLNKLKSGIKNGTEVALKLSSNVVILTVKIVLHILLTNTQMSKLCKVFVNNSTANKKLSKTQLHKTGQSLVKSVLIPLGLRAA